MRKPASVSGVVMTKRTASYVYGELKFIYNKRYAKFYTLQRFVERIVEMVFDEGMTLAETAKEMGTDQRIIANAVFILCGYIPFTQIMKKRSVKFLQRNPELLIHDLVSMQETVNRGTYYIICKTTKLHLHSRRAMTYRQCKEIFEESYPGYRTAKEILDNARAIAQSNIAEFVRRLQP